MCLSCLLEKPENFEKKEILTGHCSALPYKACRYSSRYAISNQVERSSQGIVA